MNPPPLFSIVIATKNRPAFLAQALASVVNQSYHNWELIVVDDGSDPDAAKANAAQCGVLPNTQYQFQAAAGPAAARARGLARARGAFLCFLDDDDLFCLLTWPYWPLPLLL
ncbi:MAG: glycosyltransferase [Lewinella sp.]|nr:glycosyltransferase [Lewinella sp.]